MTNPTSYPSAFLLLLLLPTATTADASGTNMTAPMERSEQDALYSVIQTFVGKWWDGGQLYPDPCGWTAIQGVSCDLFDGLWYITSLSLGPLLENSLDCAADAAFTTELFRLNHLRSLTFYSCFSAAHHHPVTLPGAGGWDSLAGNLEALEFRSNRGLVGPIPPDIGRLSALQSLVMVENGLSGALPPELGGLVHLKRLVLASNNFSGPVPSTLGRNLSDLLILDLCRNSLSGPLPAAALAGLTSLLKLDLSSNAIEGPLPPEMGNLNSLTLLDMRRNRLSGGLPPAALRGMRSLQVLLLSNNPMLGAAISDLPWDGRLAANLTTLDLSNTGLVGTIPDSLGSLKQLRFLALSDNRLDGRVPSRLADLPSLGALYLNGNNLTGGLEFNASFYERVGRRFAVWGNPNLCCCSATDPGGRLPVGVNRCSDGPDQPGGDGPSGNVGDYGHSDGISAAGSGRVLGWFGLVRWGGLLFALALLILES